METPKRPNIKLPEGMTLVFNSITGNWAMRPCPGYSAKYLKKDTFVPKKATEQTLFNDKEEDTTTKKGNKNLTKAKDVKNDEFYTRLEDITDELKHYKQYFTGKVIYCPCDKMFNFGMSNFAKYFVGKFHTLGVKKLICTQFNPNGFGLVKEYDFDKCGIKWEYNGEYEDGVDIDESMIDTYFLKGNGSFDSAECKAIMMSCDIVVTNPPFSLFRQFLAQIMECDKKFIILGNENAITYKEVFPLIKENKIWLGFGKPKAYITTLDKVEDETNQYEENGIVYQKFGNHCWFTNLVHSKRIEKIGLAKKYNPVDYPKYDNYDAIEVGKIKDIPNDYDGVMGVPISYLEKYNPNQFEILGMDEPYEEGKWRGRGPSLNGKTIYRRVLIRKVSELPTE